MSKSDDFIKKYLGNAPAASQKKNSQQQTPGKTSAADAFISKYNPTVDESYIRSFVSDWNDYAKKAQDAYNGLNWKSASSGNYDSITNSDRDLRLRSSAIRSYLDTHKSDYEENDYRNLISGLDEMDKFQSEFGKSFHDAVDYFSQFESQQAYDDHVAYWEDYEAKSKFDLDAGQKEIDELEAELARLRMEKNAKASGVNSRPYAAGQVAEDAQYTTGYGITNNQPYAAGLQAQQNIEAEDDPIIELEQLIAQKKQYRNQAKHIQEGNAYADTVKNADFGKYDDYVESDDDQYNWINDAQFRDSYEARFQRNGTQSKYGFNHYDRMNANEIAIYNYYYAKSGKEAAQKYLDNIQETLNAREAEEMYGQIEGNTAAELVFGISAGVNQFGTNVANNFKFKDDYIPQSAYQIAGKMADEGLADASIPLWYNIKEGKWEDKVLGRSLGQIAYDAVTTTANMAPSILVGIATGGTAGTVLMGMSAAGGAYQQALNEGFDKDQARGYSFMVGASEVVLEKLLGGISAVGGNALGRNAVKNIANADTAFKAIAKRIGSSMLSEFKEEYLQEVLDPVFRNAMLKTGEDVKLISAEALYSGILGALTGAFMEAPSAIYGESQTTKTGRKLREAGSVNDLAKIGNTFAPETVAYKLAGKVNENTGAYTIGQLFNEVGAKLTEQNISEITEALVKEGVGEITARQYAKAFAYVVEGGVMPDRMVNAIEADAVLAKAARTVLIDSNTTWNQRTQGYQDVLRKLAEDKVKGKTVDTGKANDATADTVDTETENGAQDSTEAPKYGNIQTIKNGKVTVKMDDGSEVDLKDADLDPEDSVRIETIASIDGISAEDASGIFNILKAGSKNTQYDAIGAREAYRYGYYGLTEKMLDENGTFSKSLTPEQRKAVYEMGRKARDASVEKETGKIKQMREAAAQKEPAKLRITYNQGNGVVQDIASKTITGLSRKQRAAVSFAKVLHQLGVGTDFEFFESYLSKTLKDKNGNRARVFLDDNGQEVSAYSGVYNTADGKIRIDLNAYSGRGLALNAMSHELVHFIKDRSPDRYRTMADIVTRAYGNTKMSMHQRVLREQARLERIRGTEVSYDEAYDEVVANALNRMLDDGTVLDRIAEIRKVDGGLADMMIDCIRKFIKRFAKVFSDNESLFYDTEDLMQFKDTVEELRGMFAEALVDASDNRLSSVETEAVESLGENATVKAVEEKLQKDYAREQYSSQETDFDSDFDYSELNWATDLGIITGKDRAIFERTINNEILRGAKPQSANGEYIIDTGRCLMFTDGNFHRPTLSRVIEFATEYESLTDDVKRRIINEAKATGEVHQSIQAIEIIFGQGFVSSHIPPDGYTYAGQNRGRKGSNGSRTNQKAQSLKERLAEEGLSHLIAEDEKQYSTQETDNITARDLLSSTDVSTIKNEVARKKLADYQKTLEAMKAEDQKLREIRAEIKELSFAKGPRDTKKLKDLKFESIKINNHISVYEGQLLRMEKELQSVVKRERAKVVKEAEKRDKAALAKEWMDAQVKQSETLREYRETRAALRQQESDTAVMEKEFIRITKEYEKLDAKSGKTISDLRTKLKNEAKSHRADEKLWMAEFGRLMREYDAADRNIEKLEQKIERQKAVAKERVENRNKTAMRHKIQNVVKELNSLLLANDKKRNVKEDMKGFASKALELADYLFTDHISNDDLIRKGITVRMTSEEAALVKETENILFQLYDNADNITDAEFKFLDNKRKRNLEKLHDLLAEQRNEFLSTPVYNLFNDLVTEYASLKNSAQDAVKAAYSPDVERFLRSYIGDSTDGTDSDRKTLLQNMRVKDMTMDELWRIYNAYTMVLHSIRNTNKLFVQGKTESIDKMAEAITWDFGSRKVPDKKMAIIARNLSNKIGWDYEKLYYALDRIGSKAFTELVMNVANSENIVMQDVMEAAAFRDEMVEKYGFNSWDVNKEIDREFLDTTGKKFKLTLGQMMALYAYSRREGAWDHIEYGGFVFGDVALTNPKPADAYKLSKDQTEAITALLTEEQKGYVESMQKFLSETMGEKGNEVSMLMYGIKMFNEKNYFPIRIAGQFKAQANEAQAKAAAGFSSMSNAGFTHAQNPNAKAPFVLEGFNEVWVDHVDEMSRYHGTVPALEDMRRVMNRSSYSESTESSMSIKQLMENSFGKEAVEYFDNFYREANSGAIADKLQNRSKKLLSLFRKNSVAYSLSVLIQQPTSITRAYVMIDPRYFGYKGVGAITSGVAKAVTNKWTNAHTKVYNEMLKYAPGVTMAKEIGGFDTATGGSIRSYLLDTNKSFKQKWKTGTALEKGKAVMDMVDDNAVANLPNLADKIAWIEIWNACKREALAAHPKLRPSSDELLRIVGKRFTEVVRATQVYDSIFAKSPLLKSDKIGVQMLVSFMNEPNTVANMAESALRDFTRGDKKNSFRKAAVLTNSIIFTGVLKSIVYAMRDDDEDETYIEKYTEALAGSLMDDFNPLNYIPLARDAWSLAQGYDVERSDMTIVADAIDALYGVIKNVQTETDDMTEEELVDFDKRCTEANWKLAESMAAFFGIPMKNIRREIMAILNHARIAAKNKGLTTKKSLSDNVYDAVIDSIPFVQNKNSKNDKLYDAIVSGDAEYLSRFKNGYKTEKAYHTAVRKALRENDPRIKEAAELRFSGNFDAYKKLFLEIKGEGNFTFDDIMTAVNSEVTELEKKAKGNGKDETKEATESGSLFKYEHYYTAVANNDKTAAKTVYDDLIADKIAEGYLMHEAEDAIAAGLVEQVGKAYKNSEISKAKATQLLENHTEKDESEVKKWDFEIENGFPWSNRVRKYRLGQLSEKKLISAVMDIEGSTIEEAEEYIQFLNLEMAYGDFDITANDASGYFKYANAAGIPVDLYLEFKRFDNTTENDIDEVTGKEKSYTAVKKIMAYINGLNLTPAQKDALAKSAGWADSTIKKHKLW